MELTDTTPARARQRILRPHFDLSIRARLILLAAAATLPLALFAVFMLARDYEDEQASVDLHMRETVRAFSLAVDREVKSKVAALETLATSLHLQSDDLAGFQRQSEAFLATQPPGSNIVLWNAAGQQIINTRRPYGRALPRRPESMAVQQVFETGEPWISDVFRGAMSNRVMVGVHVPVVREGRIVYDLSMGVPPDPLVALLVEQKLPEGWIASIVDRKGTIVARSLVPEKFVGKPVVPALREALLPADEGAVAMLTPEGLPVVTAFHRSAVTGWKAAISIPQASRDAPLSRILWTMAGAAALFAVTTLLAMVMADRIARPILSLKRAARSLGRGEQPDAPLGGIREVKEVGAALQTAAALLRRSAADRDRTERMLRERDERLRAALLASRTGTYRWDFRNRILDWDEGVCRLFGTKAHDSGSFYRLIHPEDRERVIEASERWAREGGDFDVDYRIVRPDGTIRWLVDKGTAIFDEAGRPLYMTGACTDITERRQAEERLRKSERRERARAVELAAVLEAVPAFVFVAHDPECRMITGSRATYELLRAPPGSNISKSAEGSATSQFKIMKDGVELASGDLPLQRAARGEEIFDLEEQLIFADGSSRYLHGSAIPLRDDDGIIYGAVGAFLDITERKQAEERRKLLTAELNHRVKNTLAVVQSIAAQTLRHAPSPEAFNQALMGRLRAMASGHTLLTRSQWQSAPLGTVIWQALRAHVVADRTFTIDGPDLALSPKQTLALSLVLHELATNAAKYGALSNSTGRLRVVWTLAGAGGEPQLRLDWVEEDAGPVSPPDIEGFGMRLIRHTVTYELHGEVKLRYEPGGLCCMIILPWHASSGG